MSERNKTGSHGEERKGFSRQKHPALVRRKRSESAPRRFEFDSPTPTDTATPFQFHPEPDLFSNVPHDDGFKSTSDETLKGPTSHLRPHRRLLLKGSLDLYSPPSNTLSFISKRPSDPIHNRFGLILQDDPPHHPWLRSRRSSFLDILLSRRRSSGNTTALPDSSTDLHSVRQQEKMGKLARIFVLGAKEAGKTAILHQLALAHDLTAEPYEPTIEDTYKVVMDNEKGTRDVLIFHDTTGFTLGSGPIELKRAYLQIAEAYVLVYSVVDAESFNRVDLIKKYLDRYWGSSKDRKEVPVVVLGTKTDAVGADGSGRAVETEFASAWSQRERVKLYEVTATDRKTLLEPATFLSTRLFHASSKDKSFSLSSGLSKKLKDRQQPGAAIVMDI